MRSKDHELVPLDQRVEHEVLGTLDPIAGEQATSLLADLNSRPGDQQELG
jgi:hypothetical protein